MTFPNTLTSGTNIGIALRKAAMTGPGPVGCAIAVALSAGLGLLMVATSKGPSRTILSRFFLLKPGEGPSAKQRKTGCFDIRLLAKDTDGGTLRARVSGDSDPGYGSTSRMLADRGSTTGD